MIKLLILDNAALIKRGNNYYTNNMNGAFVSDLKSLGADVTYCQFHVQTETSISQFDLLKHGIKILPLYYRKNILLRYLFAYIVLLKKIKHFNFVYLYYPSSFKHLAIICKLFSIPYGLYVRGQQGLDDKLSHWIYRNANVIMTVSDLFTKKINYVAQREVAFTIRPMIPYKYDDIVLNRQYYPKEKYSLLYFGRYDSDKGLIELIKAVNAIKKDKYVFEMKIVGNGNLVSEMDNLIKELNLCDLVTICPPVYDNDEKKRIFFNADLFVLPTYHEGFPRTLYESMIFGTPIITTLVGGIPALMKNQTNCIEIQPRSVKSIQSAILYAFAHYDKMGEMAKNGTELMKSILDEGRLSHGRDLYSKIRLK